MAENDSNQPKNLDEWLAQHPDLDPNYVSSLRLRVDTIGFDLDDVNKNFSDYQARQAGANVNQATQDEPKKSFSDEEYASAIELANGDLSKLSFSMSFICSKNFSGKFIL